MSEIEKTIKVSLGKRETSTRRKSLELKIEVSRKLFQGPEWLESLGRLESFDSYMKKGIRTVVMDYILSAEKQLKDRSSNQTSSEDAKNQNPN